LIFALIIIINLLPDFAILYYQKHINPSDTQIVLENYKLKKKDPLHCEENENSDEEISSVEDVSSDTSSFQSCVESDSEGAIQPRISMSMNRETNQPVPPPLTTILSEASQ